jgi:predicted Fe-Mo cluster-binding NifX family protein
MKKRFVFAKEVKELVAAGSTSMELPEGTRFSPEAADLIKEKGIEILFTGGSAGNSGKGSATGRVEDGAAVPKSGSGEGLIAVASSGKTAADQVGNVAARSPFFLIFNTNRDLIEALENPYRDSGGGAGPFVAELMGKKGVTTLVAGNFGINIKASLDEKGIQYFEFHGRVGEAVKDMEKQSR